ncbi:DUF3021 domain-containing protein [Bacillus massiliglaciei]|uniref:DUF3021 domain-containing protein n=1 Tax=Bacillus massiliglaciei TaxID=1816693 RepID=UPI000DA5EE9D|nr:DUF3021 domain-containing protein [Bacillus massiliglaciei]
MKNIIKTALLGASIGLSTSYTIITIILLQNPTHTINGQKLLLEFFLAITLGVGCGVALLIFYIERWSIVTKLGIHYVISLVLVFICGLIGKWYEAPLENPGAFIVFFAIHLAIYLVIFGVIYWMTLQEVRSINDKLKGR